MPRDARWVRSDRARITMLAAALLLAGCPPRPLHSSSPQDPPTDPSSDGTPVVSPPVVAGPAGRLLLTFEDQLSSSFRLTAVTFGIDGQAVLHCADGERVIDASAPLVVFDGDLSAGQHEMGAKLTYRGHGEGIFSYLSGYTFTVQGTHEFGLQAAQFLALHVTAYERGSAETPLSDRPQLRFEDRSTNPIRAGQEGCRWVE